MIFDPNLGDARGDRDDLMGGFRAPRRLIGWTTFSSFPAFAGDLRRNKRIDTTISSPLFDLPLFTIASGEPPTSLPQCNLLRQLTWSIPSGQAIAQRMGAPVLSTADLADIGDVGRANGVSNLDASTPLWFYILREAQTLADGLTLGPVGGRMVGEVIYGLLKSDPDSILNNKFTPSVPTIGPQFRMIDFLTFAVAWRPPRAASLCYALCMTSVAAADLLNRIQQQNRLSPEALHNLQQWLEDPSLAEFAPEIQSLVDSGEWGELEDAFYKHINIGTGGIRGAIGPGPNRINTRTIGEAAQALCQFIDARGADARQGGVVVGHEARRGSVDFARVCCEVFAANGIRSFRFDGVRSTPQISFTVRHLRATAGVQITASHNPKTDNGFKFYWSYGGQVVPPLDQEFMQLVSEVREIKRLPLDQGGEQYVTQLGADVDEAYLSAVGSLSVNKTRSAQIVFGAIHGAGKTNVLPVLERAGFSVQPVPEQLEPDSNFPTAAGKLINPEYREVCERPIAMAERVGADLALCSDPDADRAAVAARRTPDASKLDLLRGDDVGAALTHFVLNGRKQQGLSSPNDLVLETYVTTSLVADIARGFGVECVDDLNVGFKWMAQIIQQREDAGRIGYFFATEESIGYLAGNFVRDKDASIAALLVAEMASALKDRGITIWQYLDELYAQYGCYRNLQHLVELPGKTGMQVMTEVMLGLRRSPPATLGGRQVVSIVDRLPAEKSARSSYAIGSGDDMVTFVLSEDQRNRVTVRPSGTEPKLKYYIQLYSQVPSGTPVPSVREPLSEQTLGVAREIVDLSGKVIGTDLQKEWSDGIRRIV